MRNRLTLCVLCLGVGLISGLVATGAAAQTLSPGSLVDALKGGGCVIVMRHASSPRELPDSRTVNPDNVTRERQLDDAGRTSAAAMGRALKALAVPVSEVFTSPTYRARETVALAQLPRPMLVDELGDAGQSMQAVTDERAAWLRRKVAEIPAGTVTVLVTHQPNIAKAFPQAADVLDGEALVFAPDAGRQMHLVGRVKIEEWPRLVP